MLCPSCGTNVGDSIRVCDNCLPPTPPASGQEELKSEDVHIPALETVYAGFWIRFAAVVIDGTIIGIPLRVVELLLQKVVIEPVLSQMLSSSSAIVGGKAATTSFGYLIFGTLLAGLASVVILCILFAFGGWFYFSYFESSESGATPGKKFCGLRVVDMNGERIDFWRASKRYWSRVISAPLFIGYFFNIFTAKKQTLHDLISHTLVLQTEDPPVPLIVGATLGLIVLNIGAEQYVFGPWENSSAKITLNEPNGKAREISSQPSHAPVITHPHELTPPLETTETVTEESLKALIEPQPTPEKDIWESFPVSPEGPHALIGLNGQVIRAKVVLGVVYPAGNTISLAFFTEKLSPEEIAEFQRRGTLTSAVNLKRAMLVLSIDCLRVGSQISANDILGYTATFYADGSSAPFNGGFKAASLSRKRESFGANEHVSLSGAAVKGERITFNFQGSGSAPNGGSNKVRWDLAGAALLFGAK